MIRFAIIGTNFVTDLFMDAIGHCQEVSVQAVYSRTMERANAYANQYDVPDRYDSLEDVAQAKNIDAVYVASPNVCHCTQAVKMLKAKKHVLCEKPIAANGQEIKEMLATAKEHGVIILEAMRPAFDPGVTAIRDHLKELGPIRRATFQYCQYSRRYDHYKEGIIENAFKPELANGAIMDIGVYAIHMLVKLFGRPKEIVARGFKLSTGADASGTIIAMYENMQAEIIYGKITQSALPSQIQGEDASMIIREIPDTKSLEIVDHKGNSKEIVVDKYENNMRYEIEEFARLINHNESAQQHNQYSVMELEVMDEARRQMNIAFPIENRV